MDINYWIGLWIINIGIIGIVINKKNLIFFLIYLEVVYSGFFLMFVVLSHAYFDITPLFYYLITMTLVAVESVIGLMLVTLYHRVNKNLDVKNLNILHG